MGFQLMDIGELARRQQAEHDGTIASYKPLYKLDGDWWGTVETLLSPDKSVELRKIDHKPTTFVVLLVSKKYHGGRFGIVHTSFAGKALHSYFETATARNEAFRKLSQDIPAFLDA